MPTALSDEEREQIAQAIRDGGHRNDVARKFKRSPSTVTKIADDFGLSFDRTQTKIATEAKQADNRLRRARIIDKQMQSAEKLLDQMFSPMLAFNFGGKENTYEEHEIAEPTFQDKRHIAGSVKMLLDSATDLEAVDKQSDDSKGALIALVEAL